MPPTLHPCLKRGLDFAASPIDPSDLVEDRPAEHHDAQQHAAKRRRVEAIALHYLRGKPPVILTASLRGPFTSDWKNPWAGDGKARADRGSKSMEEPSVGRGERRPKASQVPSPEASRAAGHVEEHMCSQPELEPLPATAPLPDEDDLSGATEFFSVETEQLIANHSPANPFWLRRPVESLTLPENSQTDKSPTRQRSKTLTRNNRQSLQLAIPREPLAGRPLPIRATPPDEWRSSASASMDISSSAKPATTVQHYTTVQDSSHATSSSSDAPDSSRLRADSAQEDEARSSQAAQHAQTTVAATTPTSPPKDSTIISSQSHLAQPPIAQSFDSLVPATTYKIPTTIQVPQSSPTRGATAMGSPSPRVDVQRSAEQLFTGKLISTTRRRSPSASRINAEGHDPPKKLRHNLVASPAPASSTGFIYRRIGQPKGDGSNAPKAKPRAVNFSSSPIARRKNAGPCGVSSESVVTIVEAGTAEAVVPSAIAEASDGSVVQADERVGEIREQHNSPQQESYRSKQSQYSTQAAMLLAQLEFQEDSSQSSTSSATLRPWSQPAQNTPPPLLLQPSPAITPLSVFNAHLDDPVSDLFGASAHCGPPVSTQDLFNAASPFAFSTVKKKSERPRRTSLRFAMASKFTGSTTAKSPTPAAERVPLKEKNTPTPWGFTQEKSSLCSPKLTWQSPQRTASDVKLPQLDFHTSLDFGPNADFTDCFLRGLDNEP